MTSPRLRSRLAAPVVAAALAVALAGCSGDAVGGSGAQGYVSGRGIITSLAVPDRREPGTVSGTTLNGREVSLRDYRGKIVVVNVWGSWCPPCRAEAPMLAALARELAPQGVVFLGINSRNPEQAGPRAFVRRYDIGYESIYDPDGSTLLAFHGTLPPNAIPSTVVIDRQGRVAGSVIGEVTRTTLKDLVHDAEGGGRDRGAGA
ncbi:MAG: TlpA disulfide reductase family protein [Nocardioidaceae bacterium]